MNRIPVGPYSYAILQALKAAPEPLSRPLLARELHDRFTPPIRPLLPVLLKLEAAGLTVSSIRQSRGDADNLVTVWKLVPGAAWRLRNYTKRTSDDLE